LAKITYEDLNRVNTRKRKNMKDKENAEFLQNAKDKIEIDVKTRLARSDYSKLVDFSYDENVHDKKGARYIILRSSDFNDERSREYALWNITEVVGENMLNYIRYEIFKRAKISFNKRNSIIQDNEPLKFYWPFRFVEPVITKETKEGLEAKINWWYMKAPFRINLIDVGRVAKFSWCLEKAIRRNVDMDGNEVFDSHFFLFMLYTKIDWNPDIVPRYNISLQCRR